MDSCIPIGFLSSAAASWGVRRVVDDTSSSEIISPTVCFANKSAEFWPLASSPSGRTHVADRVCSTKIMAATTDAPTPSSPRVTSPSAKAPPPDRVMDRAGASPRGTAGSPGARSSPRASPPPRPPASSRVSPPDRRLTAGRKSEGRNASPKLSPKALGTGTPPGGTPPGGTTPPSRSPLGTPAGEQKGGEPAGAGEFSVTEENRALRERVALLERRIVGGS